MALYHSPSIVTNGLVLNLDAGNPRSYPGSGATWNDLSGNNNHGVLTNGPVYNSANGGAINFDGVDDLISANAPPVIYPFTMAAWIQQPIPQSVYIAQLGNDANRNDRFLHGFVFDGATWRANARIFVGGTQLLSIELGNFGGAGAFPTRYMYQVVVWRSTSNREIYVNGISVGINTTNIASIPVFTKYFIGAHPVTETRNVKGNIANASIYNRGLSQEEILQNYNALRGRFGL
jgi:hypothetical protein